MIKELIKPMIERFPKVAQYYRTIRDGSDRNQPFVETPWGFLFSGHESMARGEFEPEETQLVRELMNEVDVLVNVGANVGYYCCHALSLGKKVIAVEPITRNVHYLMRNVAVNNWEKQIEIFPMALGSRSDILNMWGGGTGASIVKGWAGIPESYMTQVPVMTLDRLLGATLQGKKSLILVDVEGAEYYLLQGAAKTLENNPRPIWMIEVASTMHQPEDTKVNPNLIQTFELLFNNGYEAKTADKNRSSVDLNVLVDHNDNYAQLPVHNFLFY